METTVHCTSFRTWCSTLIFPERHQSPYGYVTVKMILIIIPMLHSFYYNNNNNYYYYYYGWYCVEK